MNNISSAELGVIHAGQVNATLDPGLVMRIGIPHSGGALTFHAFTQSFPSMVSASAFWNGAANKFQFPQATNLSEVNFALDSAGFSAMRLWQMKGKQNGIAGIFPWTYSQYVELAGISGANWWSQPDLCCEPEIARNQQEIDYRIDATATLLEGTLRVVYAWQNELAKTCNANTVSNLLKPPVPVIQGWTASDYLRSLDLLQSVWERWEPWLAPPALIGIGSVCRRNLHHPVHGLYAILDALEGKLPKGSRLHCFGAKGECLSRLKMLDWVASSDSMAFDLISRIKSHREGVSNTISRRSEEMTRWMTSANNRIKPSVGDQFRLGFVN